MFLRTDFQLKDLIRSGLLKFNGHTEMNERKIIDRKLLADLAKEVGLNASHLEALGKSRQWEIVVGGDMLERLVEIQHRFERLAVMGDDEYRGFYIEVPRPAPEEWGGMPRIWSLRGNMTVGKRFLRIGLHSTRWKPDGFMSLQADMGIPGQSVLLTGSIPILSLRIVPSIRMQSQMIRGAGRT